MKQQNMPEHYIPLQDAKALIINALSEYHPALGSKAAEVLYNHERLNIVEAPEPITGMMQCRPMGMDREYLEKFDMVIDDFQEKYGPHFTTQLNPDEAAIIDYEYVGTPSSVVYLAHELGHAIADDLQIANGYSFKDFKDSEAEEQAYLVQSIFSHSTGFESTESICRDKAHADALEISWDRILQYRTAQTRFEIGLEKSSEERLNLIHSALGGDGPLTECRTSSNAGISVSTQHLNM